MSENPPPMNPAPENPDAAGPGYRPTRGNGFGIASLILGILTMVGFAIPFLNYGTIATGVVGVALGIVGLVVKFRPRKAAIAGLILSGLGLILSIILATIYTAALAGAGKALSESTFPAAPSTATSGASPSTDASKAPAQGASEHTVTYDVTGNGTKATSVAYLTFDNGSSGTSQANDTAIPFHKTVPIKGGSLFSTSIFSLVAQSADGTSITCKITVDGKVISTNTSTGQYAVATCSGSN